MKCSEKLGIRPVLRIWHVTGGPVRSPPLTATHIGTQQKIS
jgi:hypothetical protein